MRRFLLVLFATASAISAGPPSTAESLIDFCVSSRWGYTCISPRGKALLDLSGGRLAALTAKVCRHSARGTLAVGALFLTRETLREVQKLCDGSPPPHTVKGGRGLGASEKPSRWAGLLWGVE